MDKQTSYDKLSDALDLLRMLEQVTGNINPGSRCPDNSYSSASTTVPWGGIRLTLRQTAEMISSVLRDYEMQRESAVPSQQAASAAQADAVRYREYRTAPTAAPVPPAAETVSRSSGRVRELVDDGNYPGTFNRIQLPREAGAAGDTLG